jgi:hypothetical protein
MYHLSLFEESKLFTTQSVDCRYMYGTKSWQKQNIENGHESCLGVEYLRQSISRGLMLSSNDSDGESHVWTYLDLR